jgi:hypothetical protein
MTRIIAVSAALLLTLSSTARAQGFGVGYTDIGPVLGLGGIGDASVSFGGRFERGIKALPDMGNGVLGIEASVDWWRYTFFLNENISYIAIAGTLNYHFHVEGGKWDPFLGLGLGSFIVSAPDCGPVDCSYNSGLYFVGRAGVRYFFAPAMALYADGGTGASTINVGVMFKLAG